MLSTDDSIFAHRPVIGSGERLSIKIRGLRKPRLLKFPLRSKALNSSGCPTERRKDFRRSELVRLDVEDCAFGKDGLTVTLRRSKTDQESIGRKIGIPYGSNPETCPVRVLQTWLELAEITTGPLFRSINRHGQVQVGRLSDIDVARVVKKLVERAGLDAAKYAGHSLRAGHATSAAIGGASERSIMNQTGHRSVQMVRRYIRDGSLFRENSAGKLGL
jgi:integrase